MEEDKLIEQQTKETNNLKGLQRVGGFCPPPLVFYDRLGIRA